MLLGCSLEPTGEWYGTVGTRSPKAPGTTGPRETDLALFVAVQIHELQGKIPR